MLTKIRTFMKSQKGFTLVELLVVVVIIGVLAAIAIPKFTAATDDSKIAKIKADMRTIGSAVSLYQARYNGGVPADLQRLKDTNLLTSVPKHPDGTDYTTDGTGIFSGAFGNPAVTYKSDGTNL